jgi:uncharacterized protein involved in outer membrane biogenesis
MAGKVKKVLLTSLLVVAVLLAVIGFGLVPVNLFFAKTAIRALVAEELGAKLDIEGPLRMRFGPAPSLSASGINLHLPGNENNPLLLVNQLTIKPRLMDLLDGDIFLRNFRAEGVELDYCQRGFPKSKKNSGSSGDKASLPTMAVDHFQIQDSRFLCSIEENRLEFVPRQLDLSGSLPLNGQMEFNLAGIIDEHKIQLALSGGSLSELLSDPASFPFDIKLQLPESEILVTGDLASPFSDAEISAKGEVNSGQMERATGIHHLSLNIFARGFTSRPYFEIDTQLKQIDLQRLMNATEGPGENEEPFNFQPVYGFLAQFDTRANIRVDRLLHAPLPIEKLVVEASLEKAILEISKAEWRLAGSSVKAQASLDMNSECARLKTGFKLSEFSLDHLNRFLGDEASLNGRMAQVEFSSQSCGKTVLEHIESLQASIAASGLAGSWDGERLPLDLHSLQAEINWNEPGMLSLDGLLMDESLSLSAGYGSITSIQSENQWPLNIEAKADAAQLLVAGTASIRDVQLDLDVTVNFETSRFGSLHSWIGSNPQIDLAMQGQTSLRIKDQGLSLNNIDLRLGRSDIRGSMSWEGSDSALPMVFDLRSNTLDLNEVSSLFPEGTESEQTEALPWKDLLTQSEWLEDWLEFPPVDIDLSANHIDGIRFDLRDAILHVNLRERQIQNGRLKFQINDIAIDGALDADLRERPWKVSYESVFNNIDIGHVLAAFDLADQVDAQAQSANIQLGAEGSTLAQLLENAHIESKIEDLHWTFETGPQKQRQELDLSSLDLSTAPSSDSNWLANGLFNGVPLRAWMKTPSIKSTFNPAGQLPLTLVVDIADEITMLEAVIKRPDSAGRQIDVSISGEYTSPEDLDFSQLEPPLQDYHVRSEVTIGENEILFSQLQAQFESSHATGKASVRYENSIYDIDIEVDAPFIETEDLVHWAGEWRNVGEELASKDSAEVGPAKVDHDAEEAGILTLLMQSVDELAGRAEFNISISIDELRSAGTLLGDAWLKFRMDENEILIDPLHIGMPDGKTEVRYHGRNVGAGVELTMDLDIERLPYGGLLRLLDPDSEAQGELFIESSLVSRAPEVNQVVNHLEGTFAMALFPEDFNAEFLDIWASNLIFALLPGGESDKKMNCMVAVFEVENGNMKSKTTFLDSTDVIVRARGDIDLVNRQLDLLVAPQSKREKFLSVSAPIKVKGPFSDFTVAVAPGGFVVSMVRMYYGLIYVPWKWLTGERFPADGIATCYNAMGWELPENER